MDWRPTLALFLTTSKGLAVGRHFIALLVLVFLIIIFSFPYHNMLPSIIFALALSLPFSVTAVPSRREADPLHIPLVRRRSNVRRDSSTADLDYYSGVSNSMRTKYGIETPSLNRRGQTTDMGITNQVRLSSTSPLTPAPVSHFLFQRKKGFDTSYFAQASVGSP